MIAVSVAFASVVLVVGAATARWSSVRARRQMTAFLKRVAALPSIDTKLAARTYDAAGPPTEARLYFLDAYRVARARREVARARRERTAPTMSPPTPVTRTPALSLEHPSPARGA
jgi:hypothetical protein